MNKDINFKGFGENVATFIADETVSDGKFVVMKDNFTVTEAKNGDEIFGLCVGIRDGYAAIQLAGYVEVSCINKIPLGTIALRVGITSENVYQAYMPSQIKSTTKYKVVYSDEHTVGFIL